MQCTLVASGTSENHWGPKNIELANNISNFEFLVGFHDTILLIPTQQGKIHRSETLLLSTDLVPSPTRLQDGGTEHINLYRFVFRSFNTTSG